jgi:transmembrane sensor
MKYGHTNQEDPLPVAERIAYLIAGFLRHTLTEEEHKELDEWIVASDENTRLFEELTDMNNLEAMLGWQRHINKQKALNQVRERAGLKKTGKTILRSLWPLTIAVACLLVIAAGLYYFVVNDKNGAKQAAGSKVEQGPQPGTDKAVLTLANGRTIILDKGGAGLLANEGNISIKKARDGGLEYNGRDSAAKYNTLATPRGGQYTIVLADGTRVWLNAESFLKYPAGFTAGQRLVELKGEGYFEVAPAGQGPGKIPFIVQVGDMRVQVLGTHFNINSYGDEGLIKTTLLEGSVRVEKHGKSVTLRPGQQAQSAGEDIKVVSAEAGKETAWKNGQFAFTDATIENIAGQIARWYDVDVAYRGTIPYHFNATIDRSEPLENVLATLEATKHVQFSLEGKKLVISPRALK